MRFTAVIRANSSRCALQHANLSRRLAAAIITTRTALGPRRPNAARALCEESELGEPSICASCASPFLVRPLRQAARLEARAALYRRAWPLASRRGRQGAIGRSDRAHACAARATR